MPPPHPKGLLTALPPTPKERGQHAPKESTDRTPLMEHRQLPRKLRQRPATPQRGALGARTPGEHSGHPERTEGALTEGALTAGTPPRRELPHARRER